jgi:hypothetical protein
MLVLEQKLPREGKRFAVVADESGRDRYNLLRYPCTFEEIGKPIDFSKAEAYFPIMVPLSRVLEVFQYA